MNTIKISSADNRVLDVTTSELVQIIRIDGIDKIEVFDKNGWEYLENRMMEVGFSFNSEQTTFENVNRFMPLYEKYLQNPTIEEEFGKSVNEAD